MHDRVCEARERTGWGPRLIAAELGLAHAPVSLRLRRRRLSRRPPAPRNQVRLFEWPCPGDLLQMDTKRRARFTKQGCSHRRPLPQRRWEAHARRLGDCHSIIDDHTQLAFTEIHRDECYQQTLAREWAYGPRYRNSDAGATALPIWLTHYNTIRNHSSLQNRQPISPFGTSRRTTPDMA